ncbi:MAG: hypothetical protein K2K79_07325 [Paramuribaculum sp.]|nr:hypothetical protein [Paramuribaculum sp.]
MQQEETKIDTRRFWRAAKQWRWLLIAGTIILTAAGTWFGFTRLTKYDIMGEVLIGDNSADSDASAGGLQQMMRTFSVGGFAGTGVNNELMILGSHDVMLRTVRALDLNRVYMAKDVNGTRSRLYKNIPVRVEAPAEQFDTLSTAFNIKIEFLDNGKANVKATKGFFKTLLAEAEGITFPYMLETPFGNYQLIQSDDNATNKFKELKVGVYGNEIAAEMLFDQVKSSQPDRLADVISVEYQSDNAELGIAIVNGIMGEYNAKRRDRLHESSEISIQYYDERIAETFAALQDAERKVKEYQKSNELMGLDSELGLLVGDAYASRQDIRSTHYNIAYYETVLDILKNRLNDDVIIPSIETLGDANVDAFNAAIHARRDLKRSATEDNDALIQLNKKIAELRDLIIENSTKQLAKYKKDLAHKEALAATAETRLDKYPEYQLELSNIARNNGHLNALYSYLVNQRESAVLQHYSNVNIGFVFQPAYVDKTSGVLKRLIWPVAALLFSIFCCCCWCLLMMWCSRKVNDPMDLTKLGIENKSIKFDGHMDSIHRLRNLITAKPDIRVIYFNALNDTEDMRQPFVDSLLSIGRSVEVLDGFANNDAILTPDTLRQIESALRTTDYVIVCVADPEKVFDLENAIDAANAAMLLTLRSGKLTREQLKQILKGQTADKIFTLIIA